MSEYYPRPLQQAAEQFAKLPGIGMKTAQRLAYHILSCTEEEVDAFADAIKSARSALRVCPKCQGFTDEEAGVFGLCPLCADERRDNSLICVAETPRDVTAIERAGGFTGVYHVLHGLLSPMDGIGPDQLTIKELMSRLTGANEIILATPPTVEGEATASYIGRLAKAVGVKATRLAYGLPAGGSIEYADGVTLQRAIENRSLM
jgi:recombination protein RecR